LLINFDRQQLTPNLATSPLTIRQSRREIGEQALTQTFGSGRGDHFRDRGVSGLDLADLQHAAACRHPVQVNILSSI